jgi:hypothetical protein
MIPNIQVALETLVGWVDLEDVANGYEIHRDSFAQRAVTHRKTEVSSEWIGGSWFSRAVPENYMEAVVVWVTGDTPFQLAERVSVLTNTFDLLGYGMRFTNNDLREVWACQLADYVIETSQPFMYATTAVVRATVPRLPTVVRTQIVDGGVAI